MLQIVGGVQQRKSLTEKLDELTMLADVYEQELQTAQSQLRPVADELDENNRNLCQLRAKHEMLLEEKRKTVSVSYARCVRVGRLITGLTYFCTVGERIREKGGRDQNTAVSHKRIR